MGFKKNGQTLRCNSDLRVLGLSNNANLLQTTSDPSCPNRKIRSEPEVESRRLLRRAPSGFPRVEFLWHSRLFKGRRVLCFPPNGSPQQPLFTHHKPNHVFLTKIPRHRIFIRPRYVRHFAVADPQKAGDDPGLSHHSFLRARVCVCVSVRVKQTCSNS